jgi:hypothetical protein
LLIGNPELAGVNWWKSPQSLQESMGSLLAYPDCRQTKGMRLVRNTGSDRVIDALIPELRPGRSLSVVTSKLSIFAFQALRTGLRGLDSIRLILPEEESDLDVFGTEADRVLRNLLRQRWLTGALAQWLRERVDIRRTTRSLLPESQKLPGHHF